MNTHSMKRSEHGLKEWLVGLAGIGLLLSIVLAVYAEHMRGAAHVATLLLLSYAASWLSVVSFGSLLFALTWWLHDRWHVQQWRLQRIPAARAQKRRMVVLR